MHGQGSHSCLFLSIRPTGWSLGCSGQSPGVRTAGKSFPQPGIEQWSIPGTGWELSHGSFPSVLGQMASTGTGQGPGLAPLPLVAQPCDRYGHLTESVCPLSTPGTHLVSPPDWTKEESVGSTCSQVFR